MGLYVYQIARNPLLPEWFAPDSIVTECARKRPWTPMFDDSATAHVAPFHRSLRYWDIAPAKCKMGLGLPMCHVEPDFTDHGLCCHDVHAIGAGQVHTCNAYQFLVPCERGELPCAFFFRVGAAGATSPSFDLSLDGNVSRCGSICASHSAICRWQKSYRSISCFNVNSSSTRQFPVRLATMSWRLALTR